MPEPAPKRTGTAIIVVGVLVLTFAAVLAVGSSSHACSACHAMSPYAEAVADTGHTSIGCYDCHVDSVWALARQKSVELTRMYPAALTGSNSVETPASAVSSAPCLECHEAITRGIQASGGLSISHADCASGETPCSGCHTAAIHREASRWNRQPVMEECVLCHNEQSASTECDTCHDGRIEAERLSQGAWQVTHGPNWQETHGAGTIAACSTCHPADYCVKCHGVPLPHPIAFGDAHGQAKADAPDSCDTCHDQESFCDACHRIPMPHPETFLAEHPEVAEGYDDPVCLDCHVQIDCDACHVLHTHPGSTRGTLGEYGVSR